MDTVLIPEENQKTFWYQNKTRKEFWYMKSNELFEQIHCGLIKENTKIEVIKNGNVISKIKYIK